MKISVGRPSKSTEEKNVKNLKEEMGHTSLHLPKKSLKKLKAYCVENETTIKELMVKLIDSLD
ncbi:MAG: hypothetical protein RLZZ196_1486 [Bacteroidota bacterium]|jgi:hypothetical protein